MTERRGAYFKQNVVTGIVVSSLIFLAASLVPVVGFLFALFTPLPTLFFYSLAGRLQGLAILMLSLLSVALIHGAIGTPANAPFLFLSGCTGVFLAELLKRDYTIEKVVLYPAFTYCLFWFFFVVLVSYHSGTPAWELIERYIAENIRENIQMYARIGATSEHVEFMKEHLAQVSHFFTIISPSVVLVSIAFTLWLNLLGARILFHKNGIAYPDFGDLTRWKTPDWLIWLVIISGASIMLPITETQYAAMNVLLVCFFAYFLQGFSILSFFFTRKRVPIFIRFLVYGIIVVQQYILLFLIALGVFDLWCDFRKYGAPAAGADQ